MQDFIRIHENDNVMVALRDRKSTRLNSSHLIVAI